MAGPAPGICLGKMRTCWPEPAARSLATVATATVAPHPRLETRRLSKWQTEAPMEPEYSIG